MGEVAPGVNGRVTAAFLAEPGGRALSPVAFIESSTAEKKPENDTDQVKIDFVPDLTVDLFGPSSLAEGSHGDLFLRLENRGTGDAEDVTATLAVPAGTTFVSADGGGAYDESGKEIVWKVGRLAPNRSEDFAATIRVDVPEGRLAFEASVMSTIEDASERDNASSLSITAIEEDVSERDVLAARRHAVEQRRGSRLVHPSAGGRTNLDRDVRGSAGRRRRGHRNTCDSGQTATGQSLAPTPAALQVRMGQSLRLAKTRRPPLALSERDHYDGRASATGI